jgi:hypothetical protein
MNITDKKKVMATYRFPNNNVATFGHDGEQIPRLQGVYSEKLHRKILRSTDERTVFNGFPSLN